MKKFKYLFFKKSRFFCKLFSFLYVLIILYRIWIHTLIIPYAFIKSRFTWGVQWIFPCGVLWLLKFVKLLVDWLIFCCLVIERRKFHKRINCPACHFSHWYATYFVLPRLFRYYLFRLFLLRICFSFLELLFCCLFCIFL